MLTIEQLNASERHARTVLFHKGSERTCASCVNAMVFLRALLSKFFCRGSAASNMKHPDADVQREKYLSSNSFHMKVSEVIYICIYNIGKKVKWHGILRQIV